MKKAVLYARVSSDLQKKEGTVQSQIEELKRQIAKDGNILVKEYVDEGFSGARLDRPALTEMRKEVRTDLFETIYFLNTDRIAREVTYQTIIIAEILKQKKQIIINGKDYVNDPENKFTLTVLGAVAELERAKIIERSVRGRQMRLKQGCIMGSGTNIYGYDYHKKSEYQPAHYTINEYEAGIVRYAFQKYSETTMGIVALCKEFEEKKFKTKNGKCIWRSAFLKEMFKKEMYIGIRYFNMFTYKVEYNEVSNGYGKRKQKLTPRDRGDWVGIQVPAIVSKELFDKVKVRREWNQKRYRNPIMTQLLSNLIQCGYCNSRYFAFRRYYKNYRAGEPVTHHVASYRCNYKERLKYHIKNSGLKSCPSGEIKSELIESVVIQLIEGNLFDPNKIRENMDFFKRKSQQQQEKTQNKIEEIDNEIIKLSAVKKHTLDLYIDKRISHVEYSEKSKEVDTKTNLLKLEKLDLVNSIPLLHQQKIVENAVNEYSATIQVRYSQIFDFSSKRKFLLDFVDKIVFYNEKLEIHGLIPIKVKNDEETGEEIFTKVEYILELKINRIERNKMKDRDTYDERISMMEYQRVLKEQNGQD